MYYYNNHPSKNKLQLHRGLAVMYIQALDHHIITVEM